MCRTNEVGKATLGELRAINASTGRLFRGFPSSPAPKVHAPSRSLIAPVARSVAMAVGILLFAVMATTATGAGLDLTEEDWDATCL